MNIRTIFAALFLSTLSVTAVDAQCLGRLSEEQLPPAVRGMDAGDPTLVVRFWAWDDFNHRRGGSARPVLETAKDGILLADLNWLDADVCTVEGPVERTAVLFETLGPDGFGRWALVNLGANVGPDTDIDLAQSSVRPTSDRAVAVPHPRIVSTTVTEETLEIRLDWAVDHRAEVLSDLAPSQRSPSSIRGFALYVINGPAATPRPWDWTRAHDVEIDAVNGYSTDTTATLILPRSLWHDVDVCFALALTFDGNGDADGEDPESRSVHGEYLGAPSEWLPLPPDDGSTARGDAPMFRRRARGGRIDLEPPAAGGRTGR